MKLILKGKIFDVRDFTVKDGKGRPVYEIRGKWAMAPKFGIYNMEGQEVAQVKQKLFNLRSTYEIDIDHKRFGELTTKIISVFGPKYKLKAKGWDIDGDFLEHNYTMRKDGREVAKVRRKLITLTPELVLDVYDDEDAVPALAITLALENESREKEQAVEAGRAKNDEGN